MFITVTTAPRPKNIINLSIHSFFMQKTGIMPHFFAEPGSYWPLCVQDDNWHWNSKQMGHVCNWTQSLAYALDHAPKKEKWFMTMEDDIQFVDGAFDSLNQAIKRNKDIDCFSLYCALVNGYNKKEPGWYEPNLKSRGLCGALCLCFSRRAAEGILSNLEHFYKKSGNVHLDTAIGDMVVNKLGYKILSAMPTMVYHLGNDCSSIVGVNPDNPNRRPFASLVEG